MYLSHLMIDVGNNPDRPRPGRQWLRNIYHVHQRLSMAFPSRSQREEDSHFLRPYAPTHFEKARFLFRVDNHLEPDFPRVMIVVQSEMEPDWNYAFQNAGMFLAAPPEMREYNPLFQTDQKFHFRIRMNLSKKSTEHCTEAPGKVDTQGRAKSQGKRVALTWKEDENPEAIIAAWFSEKATRLGFDSQACCVSNLGWTVGFKKTNAEQKNPAMKFRAAQLDGTLVVTDAPVFAQTIKTGIGSGKAFGFGLLSLAPVRQEINA